MGHREFLLVTQNLSQPTSNQCSVYLTRSVRRRAATSKHTYRKLTHYRLLPYTFSPQGLTRSESALPKRRAGKPFKMRIYAKCARNPFRMRIYEKHRAEGVPTA